MPTANADGRGRSEGSPKARLTETLPTPPFNSISPSVFAVGTPRKVVKDRSTLRPSFAMQTQSRHGRGPTRGMTRGMAATVRRFVFSHVRAHACATCLVQKKMKKKMPAHTPRVFFLGGAPLKGAPASREPRVVPFFHFLFFRETRGGMGNGRVLRDDRPF